MPEFCSTTGIMRKRLLFRSWHRGTRELDLILGRFADSHLSSFTPEDLADYETLLSQSDPDLYAWITGAAQPPPNLQSAVMTLFLAHRFTAAPISQ